MTLSRPTKVAIGILAALTAIIVTLATILTLGKGRTAPAQRHRIRDSTGFDKLNQR